MPPLARAWSRTAITCLASSQVSTSSSCRPSRTYTIDPAAGFRVAEQWIRDTGQSEPDDARLGNNVMMSWLLKV